MDNRLTFFDKIQKAYYLFVLKTGRALRRLMWWIIESKKGDRLHPKHVALPFEHHHWYAGYILPGQKVLDLGCDRGGHVKPLLVAGATVVGVEKNISALEKAYQAEDVTYIAGDLESPLDFKDLEFDAVLALDILEHLEHREGFLKEIYRVVSDGGSVFLSAPNRATRWKKSARRLGLFEYSDPDHKIEYDRIDLLDTVRAAGFEIEKELPVVFDTPFDGWLDFLGALSLNLYRKAWMRKRRKAVADPSQSTGFRLILKKGPGDD